ncbi:hypothetical protein [Cryptosporangium sp. NPDC051539]|uniref:hypothetical protein n=1 Tax=Cryptosporangium sp. NPDC051539 TaxID=3363962 RepID=UPI0037A8C18C
MPTTRSRGLSTADLDTLRTQVEAGRKPKVQFTSAAGQVAGQIGQVIRFDDPSTDEWVVVRFGRDELPFAPTDLQLAPKITRQKPTAKASAPAVVGPVANGATASGSAGGGASSELGTRPGAAAAVAAATATSTRPVTAPAAAPADAVTAPRPATKSTGTAAAKPIDTAAAAPVAAPVTAPPGAAKAKPARKSTAKKAPDLTVTIGHHEGQWTISASRGARVLIKPTSIRAADALRMVSQLDSPGVTEAVDDIVAAARAEAEEQAERLRRELAEVEAALADLTD